MGSRQALPRIACLLVLHRLSLKLVDPVAAGGFVSVVGATAMPWLWATDTALTLVLGTAMLRASRRWSAAKLVAAVQAGFALGYAALAAAWMAGAPRSAVYSAAYLWTAQDLAIVRVAMWTLATDTAAPAASARWLARLAMAPAIFDLFAYTATAWFVETHPNAEQYDAAILFAAAAVGIGTAVLAAIHPAAAPASAPEDQPQPWREALAQVGRLPGMAAAAVTVALTWAAFSALSLYTLASVEVAANGESDRVRVYYALYNLASLAAILLAQAGSARWLPQLAPHRAMRALPMVLIASAGLAAAWPGLAGALCAEGLYYLVADGWDATARRAWVANLKAADRGPAMVVLDNVAYAAGSLAACVLLGVAGLATPSTRTIGQICLILVAICGAGAVVAARRIAPATAK